MTSSGHARYKFLPDSFSFVVDHTNVPFTQNLRRSSLTGQAPHPISQQLSGRINIPVEHDVPEENSNGFKSSGRARSDHLNFKAIPVYHDDEPGVSKQSKQSNRSTIGIDTQSRLNRRDLENNYNINAGLDQLDLTSLQNEVFSKSRTKPYSPAKYEDDARSHLGRSSLFDVSPVKQGNTTFQKEGKITKANKCGFSELSTHEKHQIEVAKQDKFIEDKYNLHRFHIIPDGNCLYRAVAQAVLLDQSQHLLLRQMTIEHIAEHKEEFEEIIEGEVEDFLLTAKMEGVWAGYPEILALTRWLDININITTGGSPTNPSISTTLHHFTPIHEKDGERKKMSANEACNRRKNIWLSWLSTGHYDMLTDQIMANPRYDEWLASREFAIQSDAAIANEIYEQDRLREEDFNNSKQSAQHCLHDQSQPTNHDHMIQPSYQNRNSDRLIGSYLNDPSCISDRDSAPKHHTYPAPTYKLYREHSPPPAYVNLDTKHDEELALSLQEEEIDESYKSTSYFA